ncbi:hypothetical protein [Aeromonas hydrophila]|uniref:hypothetical protein n=1 Tax=Aeromonas hydrophila TaxID=644 RepID=UPI003D193695
MDFIIKKLKLTLLMMIMTAPLLAYILTFASLSDYSLAKDDQAWANFGNFIGGTIGPIFSGLAFIGVWLNYNFIKNQATIDELQKLLSTAAAVLDEALNNKIVIHEMTFPVKEMIHAAETLSNADNFYAVDTELAKYIFEKRHIVHMYQLSSPIDELSWCLKHFLNAGGNPKIKDFYKFKFNRIIKTLRKNDCISENATIMTLFSDQ